MTSYAIITFTTTFLSYPQLVHYVSFTVYMQEVTVIYSPEFKGWQLARLKSSRCQLRGCHR